MTFRREPTEACDAGPASAARRTPNRYIRPMCRGALGAQHERTHPHPETGADHASPTCLPHRHTARRRGRPQPPPRAAAPRPAVLAPPPRRPPPVAASPPLELVPLPPPRQGSDSRSRPSCRLTGRRARTADGGTAAGATNRVRRPVTARPSVDAVLSGRVGMSPVMVGRARPFARLAGIVDAADVMTGDQPAVALVSGEAGIGKTRLVRELVQSLPARDRHARRDRPARLDEPPARRRRRARRARAVRRRAGRRRVRHRRRGDEPGSDGARRRGPPLGRRGQRQPHRPHRPAAVAEPRDRRHLPAQRPVPGPARRRARAAPRAAPLRRAGAPRAARPGRGQRDGHGDLRRPPAPTPRRRSSRPCTGAAAASRSSSRS